MVRQGDPWVILGIPRGATPALADRAGDRMVARYEPLTRASVAEVRDLATTILAGVRHAIVTVSDAMHPDEHPEAEALRQGLAALDREEWEEADRYFAAARDLDPDSAEALAHLGWARFHNPELPPREREEDGLALLELALQFDPRYAIGHYLFAAALAAGGDVDRSMRHVKDALRMQPGHAAASALARRLSSA